MPDKAENYFLVEMSLKSTLTVPLNARRVCFSVINWKLLPEAEWNENMRLFRNSLQGVIIAFHLCPSSKDEATFSDVSGMEKLPSPTSRH